SSATAALKLSEKFRRFVILVSIRLCWIHLSTLSEFAGPLQLERSLASHQNAINPVKWIGRAKYPNAAIVTCADYYTRRHQH
ncbi:hypothetical protein AB9F27_08090, partial [Falsihalocynthiibacter sp. CO-5D18]